ncbi:MAG TPA: hypothetical protein DCE56_34345 [Cyanobacteria bacterium UBA8553]|nr:hypothetical protein [Cyanobacteria bacterium UBA8553]HAJ62882.1 hypothetical protein [Cyanobacteria bacterium UBA8543]
MNACPCCSTQLLRHIRHNSIYWYCSQCRQEMPLFESANLELYLESYTRRKRNHLFSSTNLKAS